MIFAVDAWGAGVVLHAFRTAPRARLGRAPFRHGVRAVVPPAAAERAPGLVLVCSQPRSAFRGQFSSTGGAARARIARARCFSGATVGGRRRERCTFGLASRWGAAVGAAHTFTLLVCSAGGGAACARTRLLNYIFMKIAT